MRPNTPKRHKSNYKPSRDDITQITKIKENKPKDAATLLSPSRCWKEGDRGPSTSLSSSTHQFLFDSYGWLNHDVVLVLRQRGGRPGGWWSEQEWGHSGVGSAGGWFPVPDRNTERVVSYPCLFRGQSKKCTEV